jgi:hypothetical protein
MKKTYPLSAQTWRECMGTDPYEKRPVSSQVGFRRFFISYLPFVGNGAWVEYSPW